MEKETQSSSRVAKIGLCLIIAAFLQTSLKNIHPKLGPWLGNIDWLLLVTVYVGLMRDPIVALLTATAAGLIYDFSTGANAFGVGGIAYLLAGYIAYWISANFFVEGVLIRSATVAGASAICVVTRLFFYKVVLSYSLPASGALELIWGPTLNLILSLVVFSAFDQIFNFGRGGGRGRARRAEAMRGMKRRRKFKIK